jgi:hypothetical protein
MNPEKATDYLSRINWKSLVEWLTAEVILNRPQDPINFCRDLLGVKIVQQTSVDFKPDAINDWLRNCYTEATALVDEHGIIKNKKIEVPSKSLAEQISELTQKVEGMQKLLDSFSAIATLDPILSTDNIVSEICNILDCDKATAYMLDNVTQELVINIVEGTKNIRIPVGQVLYNFKFRSFLFFIIIIIILYILCMFFEIY